MHRCVAYRKKFKKENIMSIKQISNTCMYLSECMNILHIYKECVYIYMPSIRVHTYSLVSLCVYALNFVYIPCLVCVQVGAMDG